MNPSFEIMDPNTAVGATRWQVPQLGASPPTVESIEDIEASAFEEGKARGYEEGFAKGLADGAAQIRSQVATLSSCVAALSDPLARQDDDLERALLQLSVELAGQLAAVELRSCPLALRELVAAAMETISPAAKDVVIEVHPQRLDSLIQALNAAPIAVACRVFSNADLSLEDCRVVTDVGIADASLLRRRDELLNKLLEQT